MRQSVRRAFGINAPQGNRKDVTFAYGEPTRHATTPLYKSKPGPRPNMRTGGKPKPELEPPPELRRVDPPQFPRAGAETRLSEETPAVVKALGIDARTVFNATKNASAVMAPGRQKDALDDLLETKLAPLVALEGTRELTPAEIADLAKIKFQLTSGAEDMLKSDPPAKRALKTLTDDMKALTKDADDEIAAKAREVIESLVLLTRKPVLTVDEKLFIATTQKELDENVAEAIEGSRAGARIAERVREYRELEMAQRVKMEEAVGELKGGDLEEFGKKYDEIVEGFERGLAKIKQRAAIIEALADANISDERKLEILEADRPDFGDAVDGLDIYDLLGPDASPELAEILKRVIDDEPDEVGEADEGADEPDEEDDPKLPNSKLITLKGPGNLKPSQLMSKRIVKGIPEFVRESPKLGRTWRQLFREYPDIKTYMRRLNENDMLGGTLSESVVGAIVSIATGEKKLDSPGIYPKGPADVVPRKQPPPPPGTKIQEPTKTSTV